MQRSGFSLLELSIVLTILAIVVAGGLTLGTAKKQQEDVISTYDEMQDIEKALKVFLNENGRLPCPASITLARSNALFGREATDCADASPPAGITRVEYPAASGEYVRIGGVPFYSLEMPDKYLEDAWQGRYLYAVHEDAITSLTSTSTGTITVNDDNGTSVSDEVVAAIVSHGKSHKGSYSAKAGALFSTCDATNKDKENCDADGVFTDAVYNDGSTAANFYDDLVIWDTRMRLFDTVNTSGSGFDPWEIGEGHPAADYPLEIKGFTTAIYASNLGISAFNTACAAQYSGSWMLRSSDLQYVDNLPVMATSARFYIDDCVMETANNASDVYCSLPNMPQVRLNAGGTISSRTYTRKSINELNCLDWSNNTAGFAQVLITNTSAATNFRKRGATTADNTSFTNQTINDGTLRISTTDCTASYPLICVGER
jgi:prepilin-type N-terminal cleavage/methylation domain-containing protein